MNEPYCTVVIPSRDGEKTLPRTLDSLLKQDVPLLILVADDYSVDDTPAILREHSVHGVKSIRYPTREKRSYARVPVLLNMLKPHEPQTPYYMVSGDDTEYTPSYIKEVTAHMEKEGSHVASGYSVQYKSRSSAPGGSGRIYTSEVWNLVTPFYENIAWETGALYKARKHGYRLGFYQVQKSHIRPQTPSSTWTFGHAAYLLGTPVSFTLFRVIKCILTKEHSLLNAACILLGQLEYELKRPERVDLWPYVRAQKYKQLKQGLKTVAVKATLVPLRKLKRRLWDEP